MKLGSSIVGTGHIKVDLSGKLSVTLVEGSELRCDKLSPQEVLVSRGYLSLIQSIVNSSAQLQEVVVLSWTLAY